MYADDIIMYALHQDKNEADDQLQSYLHRVGAWNGKLKLMFGDCH